MNERIKKLWVEALRSGEYEQDVGRLKTDSGYCCLGVLCDLSVKEAVIKPPVCFKADGRSVWSFDGKGGALPISVMIWADLGEENPVMTTGYRLYHRENLNTLAKLNDGGLNFQSIADLIEKNL